MVVKVQGLKASVAQPSGCMPAFHLLVHITMLETCDCQCSFDFCHTCLQNLQVLFLLLLLNVS